MLAGAEAPGSATQRREVKGGTGDRSTTLGVGAWGERSHLQKTCCYETSKEPVEVDQGGRQEPHRVMAPVKNKEVFTTSQLL
jgi:hypothetical protein